MMLFKDTLEIFNDFKKSREGREEVPYSTLMMCAIEFAYERGKQDCIDKLNKEVEDFEPINNREVAYSEGMAFAVSFLQEN